MRQRLRDLFLTCLLVSFASGCGLTKDRKNDGQEIDAPTPDVNRLVESGPRLLIDDMEGVGSTAMHDESSPSGEDVPFKLDTQGAPETLLAGNCTGPVGGWGYCSASCPCDLQEGDCDGSGECATGLTCMRDTGALFGFDPGVDVCLQQCSGVGLGTPDYCASSCPCDAGQGDCDSDDDCTPGNSCVQNVGAQFGFAPNIDVCMNACDPSVVGTWDFCSDGCPACSLGQGDCDSDSECGPGLQCADNVGLLFGYSEDVDVCVMACDPLLNGTFNYCSETCLCTDGEGDCDSDADCAPGHTCVEDIGASYGFSSEVDICLSSQVIFAGNVMDTQNRAVANATISINGQTVLSEADGSFSLSVAGTDKYIFNVQKIDYVTRTRIHVGRGMQDMLFTLEKAETFVINPTQAAVIEDSQGARLAIPPNALVDEDGHAPTGPVTVQIQTINPAVRGMPGDMTGVNSNGDQFMLESIGVVSVEMVGANGKHYQPAPGQTTQLSIQIPPEIDYTNNEIAVWYFDTTAGVWVEDGIADVSPEGVATTFRTHYSAVNFDLKKTDPACIAVHVPQQIVPVDGSIQARIVVKGPIQATRTRDLNGGPNVLYNLPTFTDVDIFIPPNSATPVTFDPPLAQLNSGAKWSSASGYPPTPFPPAPHSQCNGQATLSTDPLPSRLSGIAWLEKRTNQSGITVTLYEAGTTNVLDTILSTPASGHYSFEVDPSGTYDIELSHFGHLDVRIEAVTVASGKVNHLPCVQLLGGDINKDGVIDSFNDELALVQHPDFNDPAKCIHEGLPHDLNGDGCINTADRGILITNLNRSGPIQAANAKCSLGSGELTTTYAHNNGQSGNMFNITAKGQRIKIRGFDGNIDPGTHTFQIWRRPGGLSTSSAGWILLGTTTVTSAGNGGPTPIPLPLDFEIAENTTVGFYLTTTNSSGGVRYTNGTGVGNTAVQNDHLIVHEGYGVLYGSAGFNTFFNPRIWNGTVHYDVL